MYRVDSSMVEQYPFKAIKAYLSYAIRRNHSLAEHDLIRLCEGLMNITRYHS